jgi:endonuclease YncB( thermonuclease family)
VTGVPTLDNYARRVAVVRVIDGDTFLCVVDLGFYVGARMSCRIAGINAAEHNEPGGPEAKARTEQLLGLGVVDVESVRADKYAGRFDAHVIVSTPLVDRGPKLGLMFDRYDVGQTLVDEGLAVPWNGTGPRPHVPWPPTQKGQDT